MEKPLHTNPKWDNLSSCFAYVLEDIHRKVEVEESCKKPLDIFITQLYSCVMIPSFVDIGSPWKVLPPGIHNATMDEIEDLFAISDHRKNLFAGLKKGADVLRKAGCRTIFLNGSFVTEKSVPKDYDACWDTTGVDVSRVDPVLLDFSENRKKQKAFYYGEFFPLSFSADRVHSFFEYFQIDKHTGKPKGIINLL